MKQNWSELPPELFLHISAHLDEDDLISMSGVCLSWYKYLNGLVLPRFGSLVLRPLTFLPEISANVRKLHIVNHDVDDFLEISHKIQSSVEELSIALDEEFTATEQWIDTITSIIHSKVHYLQFKNIIFDERTVFRLFNTLPLSIETLVVHLNSFLNERNLIFENIKELFTCLCFKSDDRIKYIFTGRELNQMLKFSNKIRHCEIISCGLEENHYLDLFNENQIIETLIIRDAFNLSLKVIKTLSKMKHLKHLEINNAHLITDPDWSWHLNIGFKCLEVLKITQCKGLSDQTLDSISRNNNLKVLEIEILNCSNLEQIFNSLPSSRLSNLTLHTRICSLDDIRNYIKFPSKSLNLIIYGPFYPEYYLAFDEKISEISKLCNNINIQFDYSLNLTNFKSSFIK